MINVIIAEDNVPISVHLSNAINTKNVRCVAILNEGNDVYPNLKKLNPDILILDLKMPGKNGLQILEEITKDNEIKTKVMIYSGEMEYITLAREYECVCRFISKMTPYEEVSRQLEEIAEEIENRSLENKVAEILFKLGFVYSLRGTRLISHCIVNSVKENNDNVKLLYENVSKKTGYKPNTIKSDIHTAIDYMWKFADKEKTRKILRIGECDKPSTKTVISMVKYYVEK